MVEVGSSLQAGRPVEVEIPNWVSRPDPSWGEAESSEHRGRSSIEDSSSVTTYVSFPFEDSSMVGVEVTSNSPELLTSTEFDG